MTQSLSSLGRAPREDPTHRAIFAGRRLILVPWERGIEPESDPFDPAPRPDGKERPVVFDIWEDGESSRLLARQHGAGEASTEVDALHRWAGRSGADLRIGAPLGPRAARVPCRDERRPSG
jgi:hypothetical protein